MDQVTLKRGRGTVTLVKSSDLIAIRPVDEANFATALSMAPTGALPAGAGATLGGMQLARVAGDKAGMESALDRLRDHALVQAGSHVYHSGGDEAPVVPTGKITLRFTPDTTPAQRQAVLDENHLETVSSSIRRDAAGKDVETWIVRVTPTSPNPLKVAEKLQQQNDLIALAEPDLATPGRLFAFELPPDEWLHEQWHLKNDGVQLGLKAGADARVVRAWQRAQSLGSPHCVVAVIDDGFDLTHPDLSGDAKIIAPWDFESGTPDPTPRRFTADPRQADWHGTACAAVAIGNAGGGKIVGAAPDCGFMPVRWNGSIDDASIGQLFAYVAKNGAWVVNCSWGAAGDTFYLSTIMDEAIADCARQGRGGLGCVVVFAAGNSNLDIDDPVGGSVNGFATHPDVIAVAASNSQDKSSNYSNFGDRILVCAPSSGLGGRGIVTADVRGTWQDGDITRDAGFEAGDYTRSFGGTSSAAPLVAGIAALLLSAQPQATAAQIGEIIKSAARRIGPGSDYDANGHSIHYGYGCIDADSAVQAVLGQNISTAA
jgi:hypothetical protein